jgi:hypothetical protein
MRFFIFVATILMLACSCNKEKQKKKSGGYACTIDCSEQLIVPELRYIDSGATDTVLVKIYEPDSSFTILKNSEYYYDQCQSLYMEHGNDYEIITPQKDTFRIWGFDTQEPTKKETWCPDFCYYYTRKLLINGKITYPYYGEHTSKIILFEK